MRLTLSRLTLRIMDLVGTTEIGQMLGVSKQRADQLARTKSFPKPVAELAQGRVWRRRDVERWVAKNRSDQ